MLELAEEQSERALVYRDLIEAVVEPETMQQLDNLPEWIKSKHPHFGQAAYLAEYWYGHLRTYRHEKAVALCHLNHESQRHWHDRCPRCWLPLEKIRPVVQLSVKEQRI